MTSPTEEPQSPTTRRSGYAEIAPGVPRYGQYAPEGWQPPQEMAQPQVKNDAVASSAVQAASAYPGFDGKGAQPAQVLVKGSDVPVQVRSAVRFIRLAGALQGLSALALLLVMLLPSLKSDVIRQLQTVLPAGAEYEQILGNPALLNGLLVTALFFSVIGSALYFWLANKIKAGRSWARTTGLVFTILSLIALFQPSFFTIMQVGLGVIAMVILYRSPAKEHFKPKR